MSAPARHSTPTCWLVFSTSGSALTRICSPARRCSAMWRGMNVSFRDMLFLLVFGYLIISAVALAHVAKKDEDTVKSTTPPGNVIVEMNWAKESDSDVDLWVQAPGD